MRRFLALTALGLFSCADRGHGSANAVKGAPTGASSGAHALSAGAPAPSASAGFVDPSTDSWTLALRAFDFAEATRRIDALPAERASAPEVTFVRARLALELRDYGGARTRLSGLETSLPVLADAVRLARAEAELEVGPFEDAAKLFAARTDLPSLVKGAVAWERARAPEKARPLLDRVLRALGTEDGPDAFATRVAALSARARIARASSDAGTAQTDLRYLAVEAPATPAGRSAAFDLAQLVPPAHLTAEQRLTRVRKLAEGNRLEDAFVELDALEKSPDRPDPAALAHARGWAYYLSRSDYAKAAVLLDQASKLGGPEATKDAFYAARALSRAQDDAHAIERYTAFARKFPKHPLAEEALYQVPRLHMLASEWDPALAGYKAYLDAFGKNKKGRFVEQVRYEIALTHLAAGHGAVAAPLFAALSARETDSLDRAFLHELEGAALADAGDTEHAATKLAAVIDERPLSFPALVAASRLTLLKRPLPAAFADPAPSGGKDALAVELPEPARTLSRLGFSLDAEQSLKSHESELSSRYAPRGSEALCQAYGAVGAAAERYRVGRAAVKADVLDRAPTEATRWAWDCIYPTPFAELVRNTEEGRALPAGLLYAVMRQESAFRADAVSPANAVGLLQIMPDTAAKVGKELGLARKEGVDGNENELARPGDNVRIGAYYLRKVFDTFGGSVPLAAAAYNAGPRAVSRWLEASENLPLDVWVARIPFAETRGYVLRVVGNLARYAYLREGARAVTDVSLELPRGVRAKEGDF